MRERFVVIGPGKVGLAFGAALVQAGAVEALTFVGRSLEPPPHPLFDGDPPPADYRPAPFAIPEGTTILLLTVADSALPEVAHLTAALGPAPAGCAALHTAGAVTAEVLAPLHAAGYAVGSVHPFQTVADRFSPGQRLRGAAFAIAGEPAAVAAARRIVNALGGLAIVVPPTFRPLYHAAGVFASNYVVALASVAVDLLEDVGVTHDDAAGAVLSLIRGTVDNLEQLGLTAALTGPIVRGDVETVRLHVARLSDEHRRLYCALGRATLRLARSAGLDEERAAAIEALLARD